jgi:HK97 family phage major capsid protein
MDHLIQTFAASVLAIAATSAVLFAVLLSVAASRGGGSVAIFRTLRAVGFEKTKARGYAMEAAAILAMRLPSFSAFSLAGAAQTVNELSQAVINAKAQLMSEKATLNLLLEQQSAAKAIANGFIKKASAGTLTAAEKEEMPKADAAYEAFDDRLAAQRKLIARTEKDIATLETELQTEKDRLAAEDKKLAARPSGRVENVEDQADKRAKDPKRGFADHRDYLNAVMKAGLHGARGLDERLKPLATVRGKFSTPDGKTSPFATIGSDEAGAYSDPHGGFLVPHGVAPGILMVRPDDDPLAALVTPVTMTAPSVTFNARVDKDHSTSVSGGFVVTRRPETVEGSASRSTYEQITLHAVEEFGLGFASERIIEDSPESFVSIVQAGFNDEYAANAMKERINGTGIGERLGFLKSAALLSITKETNQAADTIVTENIDKMASRSWKYGRSIYLANHGTRPQLRGLVRTVGTGGSVVPYFMPSSNDGPETLDGRPIFFTEFCPALGDLGDILLVTPSEYLEGTYKSEHYDESIHVRFTAAERCFRFYRRNDGRPWWTSVLTPKNGPTLSPIVALAAR